MSRIHGRENDLRPELHKVTKLPNLESKIPPYVDLKYGILLITIIEIQDEACKRCTSKTLVPRLGETCQHHQLETFIITDDQQCHYGFLSLTDFLHSAPPFLINHWLSSRYGSVSQWLYRGKRKPSRSTVAHLSSTVKHDGLDLCRYRSQWMEHGLSLKSHISS